MIPILVDPHELAPAFAAALPFPHIVIDGLFRDSDLDAVLADFPSSDGVKWMAFNNPNEKKRGFFHEYSAITPTIRHFLDTMNGFEMLAFLERLTGIDGLIPDPYFGGGGLHLVERGGFLKVHIDFNVHPKLRLDRRLNMLTYLNKDWRDEYGGDLELWDRDLNHCLKRISPIFNRTVIFETSQGSFHGHPSPLQTPEGVCRKSISLYYYTCGGPRAQFESPHDTIFVEVPTEDTME